jgi:alkylation response protein AidB-like acyl-CoA dehydrogenase
MSANDLRPGRQELLARAEALVPRLKERAERCEKERRCPEETVAELGKAGLLRICQPARWGGYEYGWDALCEVSQVLARGCGSQAWVGNILNDHAQKLGTFDLRAQEDVWGRDPDTKMSASFEPAGKGRPVSGGVVFSGHHRYSSGIDHVQWVICGGLYLDPEKPPRRSFFLIPKSDGTVIDDWHVMGLSGTGSKSFAVKDVFIPDHRILDGAASDDGIAPGTLVNQAPVFKMPRLDVAATGFVAIAVGIAEAFMAEYLAYTRTRQSRGVALAQSMGTQIGAATAAAEIEAAKRVYLAAAQDAMATLERGEAMTRQQRLGCKLNAAYACQLTLAAVQRLFNAAGWRALFTDNAMQRQVRDLYAVAAHRALTWDASAAAYGGHLLGAATE